MKTWDLGACRVTLMCEAARPWWMTTRIMKDGAVPILGFSDFGLCSHEIGNLGNKGTLAPGSAEEFHTTRPLPVGGPAVPLTSALA